MNVRIGPASGRDVTWFAQARVRPRKVTGTVVRDGRGGLFEALDGRLHPLHRPVADVVGELLDLVPADDAAGAEPAPARPAAMTAPEGYGSGRSTTSPAAPANRPALWPTVDAAPGCRPLFPEPGVPRAVIFAPFRPLLAPQLAAPERLRSGHRLECRAQVYEVTAPQRLAALQVAADSATGGLPARLAPLTPSTARRLGLGQAVLAYRSAHVLWREPDVVLPGERFVALRVAVDPTLPRDRAQNGDGKRPTAGPTAGAQVAGTGPQAHSTGAAATARPSVASAVTIPVAVARRGLRTRIHARYMQPWDLLLSRDEAIYDMRERRRRRGVAGLLGRVNGRWGRRGRMRKWRELLYGRTADDQLWAVRPPRRGYEDPEVVAWARQMLAAAGFDSEQWLPEWELFWRRKGV